MAAAAPSPLILDIPPELDGIWQPSPELKNDEENRKREMEREEKEKYF